MSFERPTDAKKEEKLEHSDTGIEAYVTSYLSREPSTLRKAELNAELAAVSDFFREVHIKAYVTGGTGIDLLDGKWDRDHQDLDMAIRDQDRQRFYNAATHAGFLVTDADRRPLSAEEVLHPATHNAFLFRSSGQGETKFEVMFLTETADGDIELTPRVIATRESFEQAPTRKVAGREVTIQPPETNLFYKLLDGRRKDFRDARGLWDSLLPEQRERLNQSLQDGTVRFMIDGEDMKDVPTLLEAAEQKEAGRHRAFFDESIPLLEAELGHEVLERCEEFFEVRQRSEDRAAFFEAVAERYRGLMPEERPNIEPMANFLYQDPAPGIDQFKAWARRYVKLDERIKKRALHDYVSEKLWEVKVG